MIILGVAMLIAACGDIYLDWSEQVQSENGQVVVAKHTVTGEKLGGISGPGGWEPKEISIHIQGAV